MEIAAVFDHGMGAQRVYPRGHRPEMQVMDLGHAIDAFDGPLHLFQRIPLGTDCMRILNDSLTRFHDENSTKTPINILISGSARYQPVVSITTPAAIRPPSPPRR